MYRNNYTCKNPIFDAEKKDKPTNSLLHVGTSMGL